MKHIMISIRPEWTEKILNRKKILEIRKTMPKCEMPCKVYIYCTKNKTLEYVGCKNGKNYVYPLSGKVVGEFTLNYVEEFECSSQDHRKIVFHNKSCLTLNQVQVYCNGQTLYGWHIDNLEIYETPKELREFGLTRAPQSWCYVEEV